MRRIFAAFVLSAGLIAAPAAAREIVVGAGDNLSSIAARELGEASRWREIAEANGISDPRRLRAGQVLRIPDGESSFPISDPVAGAAPGDFLASARAAIARAERLLAGRPEAGALLPARDELLAAEAALRAGYPEDARARAERARSEAQRLLSASGGWIPEEILVRAIGGPVRLRARSDAPWSDLSGETRLLSAATVMTSSRGSAEIRVGNLSARLSPSGVLSITEAREGSEGARRVLRLALGEARLDASRAGAHENHRLAAGAGTLELGGAFDLSARADTSGRFVLTLLAGSGEIASGAEKAAFSAGWEATGFPGGRIHLRARATLPRLLEPADGAEVDADEIRFAWEGVTEARSYRFHLRSDQGKEIQEEVAEAWITVRNMPEGDYRWEVFPLDADGRVLPGPGAFRLAVDRTREVLDVASARYLPEENRIRIEGTAWRGARVRAGDAWEALAFEDGRFAIDGPAPAAPRLLLAGLSASSRPGGRAVRNLVAIPILPSRAAADSILPIRAEIDTGMVELAGGPLPEAWRLLSGENQARFSWRLAGGPRDGDRLDASVRVGADLEAPEILSVSTTPSQARSGDTVTIRVVASDGPGQASTGLAASAEIRVEGPGEFSRVFTPAGRDGVYEVSFLLPDRMPDGILWVRRIEVKDGAGRARVLSTEGMSSEINDPHWGKDRVLGRSAVFMGLGILIGAAF